MNLLRPKTILNLASTSGHFLFSAFPWHSGARRAQIEHGWPPKISADASSAHDRNGRAPYVVGAPVEPQLRLPFGYCNAGNFAIEPTLFD